MVASEVVLEELYAADCAEGNGQLSGSAGRDVKSAQKMAGSCPEDDTSEEGLLSFLPALQTLSEPKDAIPPNTSARPPTPQQSSAGAALPTAFHVSHDQ